MERLRLALVEFPADDPERALRFWGGLLGVEMGDRVEGEGEGWQSRGSAPAIGVHARGPGPGDTVSLPYFEVDDLAGALRRVQAPGGSVVHPGERWAVCKDSEGSPFGLAARAGWWRWGGDNRLGSLVRRLPPGVCDGRAREGDT